MRRSLPRCVRVSFFVFWSLGFKYDWQRVWRGLLARLGFTADWPSFPERRLYILGGEGFGGRGSYAWCQHKYINGGFVCCRGACAVVSAAHTGSKKMKTLFEVFQLVNGPQIIVSVAFMRLASFLHRTTVFCQKGKTLILSSHELWTPGCLSLMAWNWNPAAGVLGGGVGGGFVFPRTATVLPRILKCNWVVENERQKRGATVGINWGRILTCRRMPEITHFYQSHRDKRHFHRIDLLSRLIIVIPDVSVKDSGSISTNIKKIWL